MKQENSKLKKSDEVKCAEEGAAKQTVRSAYGTKLGGLLIGKIEDALDSDYIKSLLGKVDLIFTSPPFPLVRKKDYGNKDGEDYLKWLEILSPKLTELLSPTGSIVMEIGNAWEEGAPVMSTLPLRALLAFQAAGNLKLCQHIICHNPARLPSPAAWVSVKRIRLKDSYTHVWWMSKVEYPKADNKRVLVPYSAHMKRLLQDQKYNAGRRPSGHVVSEKGFLVNHGGAICPSVIDFNDEDSRVPMSVIKFSNTTFDSNYVAHCQKNDLPLHPARMRAELASFFIEFLTDPGDVVMDPFAGSNTTGAVAEVLGRRWAAVEENEQYAQGSLGRFRLKD